MTWEIATALLAFIGGLIAIIKPILSLSNSITELNVTLKKNQEEQKELKAKTEANSDTIHEHDLAINTLQLTSTDHEKRISDLEKKD